MASSAYLRFDKKKATTTSLGTCLVASSALFLWETTRDLEGVLEAYPESVVAIHIYSKSRAIRNVYVNVDRPIIGHAFNWTFGDDTWTLYHFDERGSSGRSGLIA